jgi:hypothetical protein
MQESDSFLVQSLQIECLQINILCSPCVLKQLEHENTDAIKFIL